ncbi:MAG: GTP-binding protein [Bacteroidota bacterium]
MPGRAPAAHPIPVVVLTGFLGAGKTTLLSAFVRGLAPARVAVIVGDLSEADVDAETVERQHVVPVEAVAALHGGTLARPDLADHLRRTVIDFAAAGFDAIVVETSGAEDPIALLHTFLRPGPDGVDLRATARVASVVAVLDVFTLVRDYGGASAFLDRLGTAMARGERPPEVLLAAQLQVADAVVITKSDLVDAAALDEAAGLAHALAPGAYLALGEHGQLDAPPLLAQAPFHPERFETLLDAHHDARPGPEAEAVPKAGAPSVAAEVVRNPRPLHPKRLMRLVRGLPRGLYRMKGVLHLASRPDRVLFLQVSGSRVDLEAAGTWRAAAAQDRSLLPEERTALADQAGTDSVFGDRICDLTLIGTDDARTEVVAGLQRCFLTDTELRRWRLRQPFADPWPTRERKRS